ncbi:unnamed protein product [Adineta ricciae]|uniref:Uncharacterized protein n=1 Tax=Adineta ricciae TaxID=249248 RepID=A0A813XSL6_ADIRI|nr:unnamed protein product [Adineta ricciae]
MNLVVFTLLLSLTVLPVQGKANDYLAKFFKTRNPDDLHEEAKRFLSLWFNQQRAATDGHWCCAINPPSIPVFSSTGDLLHYQPQPCPDTHMVCYILPAWQTLFATFGSSMTAEQILNAVHQIG